MKNLIDNPWVAPGVGLIVFLIGLVLLRGNLAAWKRQKNDDAIDEADREHYHRRFRRRAQTSAMLMLLGVMIPLGDPGKQALIQLVPWHRLPLMATIYWGLVLLAVLWIMLLAIGDMLSTTAHSRVALSRIRQQQRELQEQLAELQSRRSNGKGRPQE